MLYTCEKMKDVTAFLYRDSPSNFAHKSDSHILVAGKIWEKEMIYVSIGGHHQLW